MCLTKGAFINYHQGGGPLKLGSEDLLYHYESWLEAGSKNEIPYFFIFDRPTAPKMRANNPPSGESTDHGLRTRQ